MFYIYVFTLYESVCLNVVGWIVHGTYIYKQNILVWTQNLISFSGAKLKSRMYTREVLLSLTSSRVSNISVELNTWFQVIHEFQISMRSVSSKCGIFLVASDVPQIAFSKVWTFLQRILFDLSDVIPAALQNWSSIHNVSVSQSQTYRSRTEWGTSAR